MKGQLMGHDDTAHFAPIAPFDFTLPPQSSANAGSRRGWVSFRSGSFAVLTGRNRGRNISLRALRDTHVMLCQVCASKSSAETAPGEGVQWSRRVRTDARLKLRAQPLAGDSAPGGFLGVGVKGGRGVRPCFLQCVDSGALLNSSARRGNTIREISLVGFGVP